jgi:beta-phosphoglucomutase
MSLWPRAILFDFDNVLVNSEPLHFLAFHTVLKEEQIELTESEYYGELLGFDDKGAIRHIFAKHKRPLEPRTFLRVMTRKKEAMLEQIHSRKYAALPGVEAFVRGVWRHYPLAICSGALADEIDLMLEGIALRDCFAVIVAAEDVTKGKPDPEGYLLTLERLGARLKKRLEPADTLVVEDSPSVVKAVRARGFPVLALTNSSPAEKFQAAGANWIAPSLHPDDVQRQIPGLRMTR